MCIRDSILAVRFVLWFRRLLFWLGFFSALSCILNYEVHKLRLAAFALGAGILMMTLSRANLLLNDRLRFWQLGVVCGSGRNPTLSRERASRSP